MRQLIEIKSTLAKWLIKKFCIKQAVLICCAVLLTNCMNITVEAAPILKLNSHGHDVAVLQENLKRLKYNISNVSGDFDKETLEAVKDFQKKNKLNITGIVDRETWWAIKGGKPSVAVSSKKSSNAVTTGKKQASTSKVQSNSDSLIWSDVSSVPYGRTFLEAKEVPSLLSTAKNYMGVPYVFGGDTPNEGFDCSGFLEYVFAKNGIGIPRTADEQYKLGKWAKSSDLVPGDLVFFTTYEPGASHCGIYLGNNNFIHASTSRGVRVDSLNDAYWAPKYYGGKHIVK